MTYAPWTGTIKFPGAVTSSEEAEITSSLRVSIIPLDASPNQTFETVLSVDGRNLRLRITLRFNAMADYWAMRLVDPATGETILDSIPLVTGRYPAANLLGQYAYLGIGSAFVVPTASVDMDFPDDTNLGTEFVLVWGDTGL